MGASFGKDAGLQASIQKILRNVKTLDHDFRTAAKALVGATAREIQTQAKLRFVQQGTGDSGDSSGLKPHRVTGALSRAIKRSDIVETETSVEQSVFVGNEVEEYAVGVELGTRAHIIRIKNKKVLANRKAGKFFGKVVDHPGSRPHPFLKPAGETTRAFFQAGAKRIAEELKR